jgi:prepilin-type processing-associated H-X9-DG protein
MPTTPVVYSPDDYLANDTIFYRQDKAAYAPASYMPVYTFNLASDSNTIALGEMNPLNTSGACDLSYVGGGQHATQWTAGSAITALRVGSPHSGGMNLVWADGHTKWMNATVYENPNNYTLWYPGYVN